MRRLLAVVVVTMVVTVMVGCATTDVLRLETTTRPPRYASQVQLLLSEPTQPYTGIAMIVASDQGWGLSLDQMKTALVKKAALMGADVVILGRESSDSATAFMPIGTAIYAIPVENKKLVGKVIVFNRTEQPLVQSGNVGEARGVGAADARGAAGEEYYRLGVAFTTGQGVQRDDVQAATWYRKAADMGHLLAQAALTELTNGEHPVAPGRVEAVHVPASAPQPPTQPTDISVVELRALAEQGNAKAQYGLGAVYAIGQGVPQDYVQAEAWTRKAAEQGNVDAEYNLGALYTVGRGVLQDYVQAVAWTRKAAEQGHIDGQADLGAMYREGRGVPQDDVQAHKWLNLAAARASGEQQASYAKDRDTLAALMTPDQRAEAQKAAREWRVAAAEVARLATPSGGLQQFQSLPPNRIKATNNARE